MNDDRETRALPGEVIDTQWAPVPAAPKLSYWQLAWGNKWIMLLFLLLGTAAGFVYVVAKAPRYRASTTVEIVGFNQSFMNMNQVDPQAGTDTFSASASNIQTQMRVLTSRTLLSRVMDRMNLEITPVTSTPSTFFTKIRARIPFEQKEPLEQSREALKEAAMSVNTKAVGATRLIEIQCESTSPEIAASFLNTLAAEHISQGLASRASATQRTSQWMDSQLEEAKARLQQAGEKLREFVQKSGMDFFPEQATLADTKLRQLQSDVSSIQADRIAKQARWESAKKATLETLPDIVADPNLMGLKAKIGTLRQEMAPLLATLTPEHYKVKRIQSQITEVEQAFEKEKAGVLLRLQNDYEEALRREKMLAGAYGSQTRAVGAQADKASQYTMLKREVEMAQQVYNNLLQQSNQAALVALVPTSNIRVVDQAIAASIPSTPNPIKDIPMMAMGGAVVGYGLLWLREMARRKKQAGLFDTPGHLQAILGVPELGVIPSVLSPAAKRTLVSRLPFQRRGLPEPEVNGPAGPVEFTAMQDRKSMLAESFRQVLTSLLRSKPAGKTSVYVITSAGPGEGKTTFSVNLAVAMADVGHRVLLVDADLRRSRLHHLFGLKDCKGLSDLISAAEPISETSIDEFLQPTETKNLVVMPHGVTEVETPGLLFFSPRLKEATQFLRQKFDFILLDTAPALPFPDARLWGQHSDGVVLVVRSGSTTREGALAVRQRFVEDGIPVLGTILNDWAAPKGDKYAPYGYYAYGGSASSRPDKPPL